jgi:putative transcriptional regulator
MEWTMFRAAFARAAFALAAIVFPAALLSAALPDAPDLGQASLVGQVLIASPSMRDPRFDHAVILMVRHSRAGAFGIVVNHPVGERSLASLLKVLGENDAAVTGNVRIFSGGPVQPEIGFVIHSTDYHRTDTLDIDGHVAMTATHEIVRDIAMGRGPEKTLVAFGYAGWAGGQLENELALHSWYTASQDTKLIFDEDREKVWDDAMSRRTQDL